MLGKLPKKMLPPNNNEVHVVTSVAQHVQHSECNQRNQININIHLRATLCLTFVFPLPHRRGKDLLYLPNVYEVPC